MTQRLEKVTDTFANTIRYWMALGYSFLFMVALLALGIVVFNRVQRSFMDTV